MQTGGRRSCTRYSVEAAGAGSRGSVQVVTGRLKRRGLKCVRLQTEAGGCLEHRRGLWDSVSLMADRDVLITGVGVYSPSGQTQVCVTT